MYDILTWQTLACSFMSRFLSQCFLVFLEEVQDGGQDKIGEVRFYLGENWAQGASSRRYEGCKKGHRFQDILVVEGHENVSCALRGVSRPDEHLN